MGPHCTEAGLRMRNTTATPTAQHSHTHTHHITTNKLRTFRAAKSQAQQCATRSTRPICIPQISHGLGKLEGRCRCGCRGLETGTTNRDSGFRTREQRTAYGDRR